MTEKQQDLLFDIYIDTVTEIEKFLWIEHFEIDMQWQKNLWADASMDITYKYFKATLTFDNKIIFDDEHIKETTFNIITRLFLHECFHIFCSVGTSYFTSEKDNLYNHLSKTEFAMHNNAMITLEEQMVVTLEKTFIKHFEKTKEYKDLEVRYNNLISKKKKIYSIHLSKGL